MQSNRVNNQPKDEILKNEIGYYFELATLFGQLKRNKKFPYAEVMYIECLRCAARMDDAQAHFQLGHIFIEEAKFRQQIHTEGVFNSTENLKRCNQMYEEGHAHLLAADQLNHIAAKRLRGLCLINGWGHDVDKNTGFELIVASIDQEGSWEKVPQIFAAMGLNKPEFFSAIMQRKRNIP